MGSVITAPWVLMGDWNQVLSLEDKQGGRPVTITQSQQLWQMISANSLIDLGFSGGHFTWTNMRSELACIKELLDRAWCTGNWHKKYPHANVKHLLRSHSDHHPILLTINATLPQKKQYRDLFMLTAWFQNPGFGKVVSRAWFDPEAPLLQSLQKFRQLAIHWNHACFGNIFYRKRRCKARLEDIQIKLEDQPSRYLEHLEVEVLTELNEVLGLEEEFWRHKAKVAWIKGGDRNTKFFTLQR